MLPISGRSDARLTGPGEPRLHKGASAGAFLLGSRWGGLECERTHMRQPRWCWLSPELPTSHKKIGKSSPWPAHSVFSSFRFALRILSPLKVLKYQLATRQRIDLFEHRDKNMRLMVETLRKRVSNLV